MTIIIIIRIMIMRIRIYVYYYYYYYYYDCCPGLGLVPSATRWSRQARIGKGDDTVGDLHRAQTSQFDIFEFILLLQVYEQLSGSERDKCGQHTWDRCKFHVF